LVGILLCGGTAAAAHDVPVEDVVTIDIARTPPAVTVVVQVPIAALADANLPRDGNRRLARPAADEVLQVVGQDIANRLDIRLDGLPLAHDRARVSIADDQQSVGFTFAYEAKPDAGPSLSAELHTFQAGTRQLKAIARFREFDGSARTFTVTSGSERILFEPGVMRVIRDFAGRAVRAVRHNEDALLLLLALAVPIRLATARRVAAIAFFVTQMIAVVAAGLLPLSAGGPALAGTLAASAIVVIAIQNLIATQSSRGVLVAAVCGLFNGIALADVFQTSSQFAGQHLAIGLDTFVLMLTLAQIWILALAVLALSLLASRGVPATWLSWAVSIYAGHDALHLVADRLRLAPMGSWTLDQLGLLLVAGWIAAALIVGTIDARRHHRSSAAETGRS
jgi:hypothetical protein